MVGLFAEWQPRYAAHRVATFPVAEATMRPCLGQGWAWRFSATGVEVRRRRFLRLPMRAAQPHHPDRYRQPQRAHPWRGDQAVRRVADHLAHRLRQSRHAVPSQRRGAAHPSGAGTAHRYSRRWLRRRSAKLGRKRSLPIPPGQSCRSRPASVLADKLDGRRHHVPSMTPSRTVCAMSRCSTWRWSKHRTSMTSTPC